MTTPPLSSGSMGSSPNAALPYLMRLVDTIPSMLAYWDRDLRCRFANRAYEHWFGVEPAALIGTSIRDLLGPTLFTLNEPYISGVLRGEPQTFERLVPGPDGVSRHSLASYIPDVVDGDVVGFIAQVVEITPLKQTELALRDGEQKFKALSESSPFGVYRADLSGRHTYVNACWQATFDLSPEDGLAGRWLAAVHPDDRASVCEGWAKSAAVGAEFDMEFRVCRSDGSTRFVQSRARPVRIESGLVTGYVGAVQDITDRRGTEQRLRASESFLDRTGRIAAVGGWQVDLQTRSITWTSQTARMHEVGPDYRPSYENALEFYAPEARPLIEAAARAAIEHGTPWDLELPFVTARGRALWVRSFGEVEYEGTRPVRLIGAFQDVTEHRNRQAELQHEQALRAQVERNVKALDALLVERSEMLDVLAHEVRQPLNNASAALQSASQALAEVGETTVSLRLGRAQTVLSQVLASIDNTLAVAALLARHESIQREDTDIDTLLTVAIADMPATQRHRIQVERVTTTRTASMDMSLMRLALRNLLANALRYSPPESPVGVRLTDSDEPLALVIDVIDQGSGVEAELVPRLFERGTRSKRPRHPAGHGLGLYIVRRVMELHGGQASLAHNSPTGATMRLVVEQSSGD